MSRLIIEGLRIGPVKAGNARVFHLWGYSLPIILDEEVKAALEQSGCAEATFTAV
ncbi:Conserved uncharacterized protein [Stigmatella aurantiaca DW4/3-1]|uniref:Conserved uncharacterized protein n=1 Tax=Stigmatella aurantiaca (strain DW4/3-1) TaxID=378806 RepID=Q097D1_STIAD|nr:Conserved uncharacterized protein [Stigmatella aurantiaca DW4/3-1]EAU67811.1 hypothetical protein STIAU_3079 [Stigmatella aurantiaca DW4/3-1]